jgi:hypothetical protein
MPNSDVSPGLNMLSVFPLSPPLAMMISASSSIGMNEIAANVSIARIAIRTPR